MSQKSSPTMKDVAKKAGVALGTVSKVINGLPVSEEYKKKVEDAICDLHYEVNTYARGLKMQRSNMIALIVPNVTNPFFASFASHIEALLYERGIKLLLCCADGIPEKEVAYLTMAKQNKVDGIIALTYSDIGKYIADDMPLVVFDRLFANHNIPRVASDNYAGACLAIEKLLEFGCKHPVYIRFHSVFPGESDKRKDGYLHACRKYGLKPDYLDKVDSDHSIQDMLDFINAHKDPDGSLTFDSVFSHTDYHGHLFMQLLIKQGYRIPEDVQIIGFDGIYKFGIAKAGLYISSICQPLPLLAQTCVDIVLEKDRSSIPSLTLLPVTFQEGGTTKSEVLYEKTDN